MDKISELRAERAKAVSDGKAIWDRRKEGRSLTDEEKQEVDGLIKKADDLQKQITALEDDDKRSLRLTQLQEEMDRPQPRVSDSPTGAEPRDSQPPAERPGELPKGCRRFGRLRHFTGADAERRAGRFGMWVLAASGQPGPAAWCQRNGLALRRDPDPELRAQTTGTNWSSGFLVPEEFDSDLIDLRERYGVFRQYARNSPMMSDTKTRRRRAGGLTAYFVAEAAAGTTSDKTWDEVTLTAKKLMVLSTYTNELSADAVINVGDDLAGEIAYAFADKEDDCGFNGDGTSTYGKIIGVRSALTNLHATIANIAGLTVSANNTYPEITLAELNSVVADLPEFAETPNVRWFCSKLFFGTVMQKLEYAAGGNTKSDLAGPTTKSFLGYPVAISQKMPKVVGNSQVCCLLGDLSLAADFGDRGGVSIAFSGDAYIGSTSMFETDETAIRGVERFDINVHDVGNAHATAASRVEGPIVGLITAAA